MTLWGGRFEEGADPLFRVFNDSLPFDWRLAGVDLEGSIAWALALGRADVLEIDEVDRIVGAIADLQRAIADDPELPARSGEEDIHSWIEAQLVARLGTLGRKLHTGRSRNDQVATDVRLWLRAELAARRAEIAAARSALVRLARRELGTVMPGYTHLQRAQPVLLAHWCLAWSEMLGRDDGRLADAAWRLDECPLGSGALAGTGFAIDRETLAEDLGFARPTRNSLDAVAARDGALEVLAAAAIAGVTLSRLAEDLIFWASGEAGFIELSDAVTSGSSLMPQKKNPDALELVRGKSGRLAGAFTALLVTAKGLPLAYNKDLQEDKEPLFDAMRHLSLCLRILVPVLDGMTVHRERTRAAARGGHANATDLADYLVRHGVAFRDAHEIVGRIVRRALAKGCAIEDLPLDELRSFAEEIGPDVGEHLALDAVLARRSAFGGTAPAQVDARLAEAELELGLRDEG